MKAKYVLNKGNKLSTKKLRNLIDFHPHEKQLLVLKDKSRFKTICWGRRSGKTVLASYIALKYLLKNSPVLDKNGNPTTNKDGDPYVRGNTIWIVAPTYDLARRTWDYLCKWIPVINKAMGQYIKINKSTYTIDCGSGSRLELKTSDNPSSLLGAGLDLLIIDEAARVPEEVWRTHLRPTLSDHQGSAIFISTPYGKNWFYDMMLKGVDTDPMYKDYFYSHMPTRENTALAHIREEVEKARTELPSNDYLQEYEAEFIEGAGSVFRNLKDCLYPVAFHTFPYISDVYDDQHFYTGGLDLARLTDFTVNVIVDRAQEKFKVVAVDRFNHLDWAIQKPRISLLSEKYRNPPITAERNNIGDTVIQDLPGNFHPFLTTNQSKKEIINHLAILIEQKKILIPNIPTLVAELEAFSYEITPSGNVTYGAPTGFHDDFVMALALAVKDVKDPSPPVLKSQTLLTPSAHEYDEF